MSMFPMTELCTATPDYDQRPESQHEIHKPEILHTFGSNVGPLALAPQKKTFIAVGMSKCKPFNKQFYQVIVVQVIVFIKCTKFQ